MVPNIKVLAEKFPLVPHGVLPPKGEAATSLPKSWVAVCNDVYGCIACAKFPEYTQLGGSQASYGKFRVGEYRLSNFLRHQNTDGHKNACLAILGTNPKATSNFQGPAKARSTAQHVRCGPPPLLT
jgi:hypothetical protein